MEASKATRQAANCESTSSAEGASAIIGGASGVDQAIVGTGTATGAPRDKRIVIRQAEAIMSISLSRGTPRTTIVLALSYNDDYDDGDYCYYYNSTALGREEAAATSISYFVFRS
jgi:hypothetical protein